MFTVKEKIMLQRRFNHFALVAGFAAAAALGLQGTAKAASAQPFYGESASVIATPALASITTRAAVEQNAAAAMRSGNLKFGEIAGLPHTQSAESNTTRADVKNELKAETPAERRAMELEYRS